MHTSKYDTRICACYGVSVSGPVVLCMWRAEPRLECPADSAASVSGKIGVSNSSDNIEKNGKRLPATTLNGLEVSTIEYK